ncbi:alpha/beta hydrolase [Streptomyces milbemycinicus]|uniref:PGAP1-like alpha/beta domain-containing protein n=1 Tax=Streptomyces milbemycinicus TaxID=476552 RepID=UPI0033D0439A
MRVGGLSRLAIALVAMVATLATGGVTAASASADNGLGTAATETVAAPPRDNTSNEPVYFIKGYLGVSEDATGSNCLDSWGPAKKLFEDEKWSGPLHLVGFYAGDTNCDAKIAAGNKNTSIKELGKKLANHIYNNYSKHGKSVDLIGHSMGGLIARAAITGVERKEEGFPPSLLVEDAVTIATPHDGIFLSRFCWAAERTTQCREMQPRSDFLKWAGENPQSAQGTDWTVIGAADDYYLGGSALGMSADHRVWYYAGNKGWKHDTINEITRGTYRQLYQNLPARPVFDSTGAAPVRAAMNALYWSENW